MKCFVPSCGIDFHKRNLCADGLVSKHRFPRDPERRLKWLDAIPNVGHLDPETINYETVRLCSKHFHRDSFIITDNKRELLASAVPAIFVDSVCDTPYYQEFYVISDGKVEVAQPSEQLYYQDPPPEVKRQRLREKTRKRSIRYAGDIDMSTLTSHEAVIMVPKLVAKLEKANKTIRALRSANRRLREKMTKVEQLIDNKFQQSVEKGKSSEATAKTKEPGSVVRIEITPAGAGETNEEITFTDDDDDFIEEGEECVVEYEETV